MNPPRSDGNVIHADFGGQIEEQPLLDFSVSCRMLYSDEHVALARITYRVNGKEYIQHVCKGAGIDV